MTTQPFETKQTKHLTTVAYASHRGADRKTVRLDPELDSGSVWPWGALPPLRRLGSRGLGVAIMGPDGAGKSTLISRVEASWPLPVETIYMGLYQDDHMASSPSVRIPGVALAGNVGRQMGRWCRGLVHRLRGRLVLFDRYTYDSLLTPAASLSRPGRLRRLMMARACPAPDLLVVLDAPAEVLFERKGEHDLELLERHRQGLLQLAGSFSQGVVIDATERPEEVERAVIEAIRARLRARASTQDR